jgi:hypothetical protein
VIPHPRHHEAPTWPAPDSLQGPHLCPGCHEESCKGEAAAGVAETNGRGMYRVAQKYPPADFGL